MLDLTLGIALSSARCWWGFTDLSRFAASSRELAGQLLTRQGISLGKSQLFPEEPDSILNNLDSSRSQSAEFLRRLRKSNEPPFPSSEEPA